MKTLITKTLALAAAFLGLQALAFGKGFW